ncbi:MAG: cytochrome c-type biogenesis protein CcmH [Acidobacteria bacterium]|nr:cytochrome c-type biogenesis protein CcmH [Acidobacteriota bacterium]MBV9475590.1 cytochrome c-type biogenesis protein CcmH [Acidobacteriota bacterium]
MIFALLLFVATLRVPDAAQFVGAPKGMPVADAQLAARTHEVASLLRCPVCQGMSVADSPSEMAINMKEQVRELLARGYTEEQILKYFELSYGQFVLLRPKFEGVNALVWLLPLFAVVVGVAIVLLKIRKLEQPLPPRAEPEAANDDPYVSRVRELVRGDKQG